MNNKNILRKKISLSDKKKMMSEERLKKITKVASNRQRDLVVVLEDIFDPHNAAAIIRTCEGLGIGKLFFIFKKVKPYNPKKIGQSSSSSANKWVDFEIFKSTKLCFNKLKKDGYITYATLLDEEASSLYEIDFLKKKKIAIVIGNEHAGLSEEAIKLADKKIYIPMSGMVQSFNASVTAAIFISEVVRQRMASGKNYLLKNQDRKKMIDSYVERSF